jgi:hypothetical protein
MPPSSETVAYDGPKVGGLRRRLMVKNWMAGAVKHPGALRRKAAAVGESTTEFARSHDAGNSTTAKQSRLAETFARFRPKKKGGLAHHLTRLRARGAFGKKGRAA